MQGRQAGQHTRWPAARRVVVLVVSVMLAVGLTTTAGNARSEPCRVRNADSGREFVRLQPAIAAAAAGDRVEVRGTCRGSSTVDKPLFIKGRTTRAWGRARLEGNRTGAFVLSVPADVELTLGTLAIVGNRADRHGVGGALLNRGTMTLNSARIRGPVYGTAIVNEGTLVLNGTSRVRDGVENGGEMMLNDKSRIDGGNRAHTGPYDASGAQNDGLLTLNDSSEIRDNRGHGVFNEGALVLNGASRIIGNGRSGVFDRGTITLNGSSRISRNRGTGVYIQKSGTLTMNGRSWISRNSAAKGAGVFLRHGTLTMNDDSTIRYNEARYRGGGIYVARATLSGVHCGPGAGANVRHNKPRDCFFE